MKANRQRRLLWIQTLTTKDKGIVTLVATHFCCRFCLRADVLWITARVLMPQEASGSNQQAHEERRRATAHQSGGREDAQWWQLQKKRNGGKNALIPSLPPIALPFSGGSSSFDLWCESTKGLATFDGKVATKEPKESVKLRKNLKDFDSPCSFLAQKKVLHTGTCLDYPGPVIAFAVQVTEKKHVGGEKTALVNVVQCSICRF